MSPGHRVALCTLGGTIASFPHAGGPGVLPGELSPSLGSVIEQILPGVEITEHSLAQVPSAAIDFDLMRAVIAHAEAEVAAGATGVVVTTGTDTLEEVAFALDLMWSAPAPLIVTGAMRDPGAPGADGPANLVSAVRVATDPATSDLGVAVVINDRIHAPSQVQKRHTTHVDALVSAGGPLGEISEDAVYLHAHPPRRQPLDVPDAPFPPVALLRATMGDNGRLLTHIVDLGYRGMVVEAAGGGSTPPSWAQPLEQIARHIPVLYAGRPGTGPALRSTYGGVGAEIDLQRRGLIPAGMLDGLKARVLLPSCSPRAPTASTYAEPSPNPHLRQSRPERTSSLPTHVPATPTCLNRHFAVRGSRTAWRPPTRVRHPGGRHALLVAHPNRELVALRPHRQTATVKRIRQRHSELPERVPRNRHQP